MIRESLKVCQLSLTINRYKLPRIVLTNTKLRFLSIWSASLCCIALERGLFLYAIIVYLLKDILIHYYLINCSL